MKNFDQKETEATRKTNKDTQNNKDNSDTNQMGIYWCKQLASELTDKFKDRESDLQEVQVKKQMELEATIKMKKKLMTNKEGVTQEDLDNVEKEERDAVNLDCTKAITETLKRMDEIKLTRTEEILLRKIVDFSTL